MKKIKKSVYLVIALMLVLIGVTVYGVSAWLTDTKTTGPSQFTVGEVSFTLGGALISTSDPIVPGQELINTNFSITNASTVDTELRVKIILTSSYPSAGSDVSDKVLITINNANWAAPGTPDGYLYYTDNSSSVLAVGTQSINIITGLKLDGAKVGNSYANASVTLTLIFEAKQADHVTWAQLANVDFSTGLEIVPGP